MARIVLNPFGSFGDLHPFLAIAIELQRRGHTAVIATSAVYRAKVQAEGVDFAPVRPDIGELLDRPEILEKLWNPVRGTEYLIRRYLAPRIEESYLDLTLAVKGGDFLVTHSAAYAGAIVAEAQKLRWISAVLQPSIFLSVYDPPVLPATWLSYFYPLGKRAIAGLFALGRASTRSWVRPVLELRRRLGLSFSSNPVFEGGFSPYGILALFSRCFAEPQPDWPRNVTTTGFVFYDKRGAGFAADTPGNALSPSLKRFLANGPPPVVFTLGSSAVMQPGTFYRESLSAAERLGIRAVLLTGMLDRNQFPSILPDSVHLADYAPYSELLPHAAATVHQGGIGTTAQALLAGHPMLVVPWAHDQPDNAERVRKLGVARILNRSKYRGATAARELKELLDRPDYAQAASSLRDRLLTENGATVACDRIEARL